MDRKLAACARKGCGLAATHWARAGHHHQSAPSKPHPTMQSSFVYGLWGADHRRTLPSTAHGHRGTCARHDPASPSAGVQPSSAFIKRRRLAAPRLAPPGA